MKHTVRRDLKEDFVDIWIEIQFNKVGYLTGCVYRTPDESIEGFDYLDNVSRHAKNLEVIVMGDVNCDINETSKQIERLLEFTMANELEQLIKEPMYVTWTRNTLIDILIASTPRLFRRRVQSMSFLATIILT